MKPKKIPMRMCVGCRESKPKREMLRVVRTPSAQIELDSTGKMSGRGAYVCKSPGCLQRAVKTKQLERALEHPIGAEIFERLRGAFEAEATQ